MKETYTVAINKKNLYFIITMLAIMIGVLIFVAVLNKGDKIVIIICGISILFFTYVIYLCIKLIINPLQIIVADNDSITIAYTLKNQRTFRWDEIAEINKGIICERSDGVSKIESLRIVFKNVLCLKIGGFLLFSKVTNPNILDIRKDFLSRNLDEIVEKLNKMKKYWYFSKGQSLF